MLSLKHVNHVNHLVINVLLFQPIVLDAIQQLIIHYTSIKDTVIAHARARLTSLVTNAWFAVSRTIVKLVKEVPVHVLPVLEDYTFVTIHASQHVLPLC